MTAKNKSTGKRPAATKGPRQQAAPVVHFEVIGRNPVKLRKYFRSLFGWSFNTMAPVAAEISEPGNYGFIERHGRIGIPGGVGGGRGFAGYGLFYVGVPDVAAALDKAERLGGKRVLAPAKNPKAGLVVAHFTDPEGHLIGLAGPK